jgi:RNA polymerase sigma-70 factor (ECF subfamily)
MGFQAEATDEMLMVRYQRGDREAFAHLVNRHLATVFSYAFQLLGSENAATAVTEATFSSVVGRAAEFKHESRFTTWLFGFAHAHSAHQLGAPLAPPERSLDAEASQDHGARVDTPSGGVVDQVAKRCPGAVHASRGA